jgi:hypothetical protein
LADELEGQACCSTEPSLRPVPLLAKEADPGSQFVAQGGHNVTSGFCLV